MMPADLYTEQGFLQQCCVADDFANFSCKESSETELLALECLDTKLPTSPAVLLDLYMDY